MFILVSNAEEQNGLKTIHFGGNKTDAGHLQIK